MFNKMNELNRETSIVYSYSNKRIDLIGEPGIVSWKSCWDFVLNDKSFRRYFSGYEFVMNRNFINNSDKIQLKNPSQNYIDSLRVKYRFKPVKNGTIVIRGNGNEDHHLT